MFLFDDGEKRALYTGDFRYDIREDNDDMRALKNFVETYDENIDYLYVDITCMDIGKLYHPDQNKLPSRPEIIERLRQLFEQHTATNLHIEGEILSFVGLVQSIVDNLNESIDVNLTMSSKGISWNELYEYLLSLLYHLLH